MPFLATISFLWRRRRHTFSCVLLNSNHELSRSYSRQIYLRRQGLHSCDLPPSWRLSKAAGVAYQWTYMHQLLLPKLVKVTLRGIFVKEFCYTSGNHGSIWANFCSPSKTTKLLQISIWLPELASKKMQLLKDLCRRTFCPNWADVIWAGLKCLFAKTIWKFSLEAKFVDLVRYVVNN